MLSASTFVSLFARTHLMPYDFPDFSAIISIPLLLFAFAERTLTKDEKELLNKYVALHLYEVLQSDLKHMLQKGTSFFDITKYYVGDFYFEEVL